MHNFPDLLAMTGTMPGDHNNLLNKTYHWIDTAATVLVLVQAAGFSLEHHTRQHRKEPFLLLEVSVWGYCRLALVL